MKLNEKFYVYTKCGLRLVDGKKINDDYAVTRGLPNGYTITHIKSGMSILKSPHRTIKEAFDNLESDLENTKQQLPDFNERIENGIRKFNMLMESKTFVEY